MNAKELVTSRIRFGYFGYPHLGGTYSVFSSLRKGLAPYGVDLRWIGVGPAAHASISDDRWAGELHYGEVIASDVSDEFLQAGALIDYLNTSGFDGVFVNVLTEPVQTNVVRYLNKRIKRIAIVHNITRGTYAAAKAIRDYVDATVGVSPRIKNDLVLKHGFLAESAFAIPNAIDLSPFRETGRIHAGSESPLRLLSLGRVVDADKGVFWLPEIMRSLSDSNVVLTVAGDGPDLPELKRRCDFLGDRVVFVGRVFPVDVPAILARHDVFLFPSRFEGLGISLVEAMASGCVPIASRIKGVTDFVVNDGKTGFLFEMGDIQEAAEAVRRLTIDPSLLERMSCDARRDMDGRFDMDVMARSYIDVVRQVMSAHGSEKEPLPFEKWAYPPGLKPGVVSYLPSGIKKWLRLLREKFA